MPPTASSKPPAGQGPSTPVASGEATELDRDLFHFAVRYRTAAVEGGVPWLDYSLHPASKLGLHNALLAEQDRIEILAARGDAFECAVFVLRKGSAERLSQAGAERLFASLPHGDVKWIDLCQCLLPPLPDLPVTADTPAGGSPSSTEAVGQLPLFPHTHTLYDDLDELVTAHALDVAA